MPVVFLKASSQVRIFFVLEELVVVACNVGFAGLGVVAKVADVFHYFAEVVFVLANKLDVLLLLVQENAGLVLLTGKLALKVGDARSLSKC